MSMGRTMARLGYQPTTDLPKGLSAELDWLQNQELEPTVHYEGANGATLQSATGDAWLGDLVGNQPVGGV